MALGIPVTTYTSPNGYGLATFVVTTLCGTSHVGMTHTPDLEISMRKALAHAEECARCQARWAELCTPGATLVSTGEAPPTVDECGACGHGSTAHTPLGCRSSDDENRPCRCDLEPEDIG